MAERGLGAGGAIFNTAIALGRLGIPTGFFTGLSDDMFGDILRETLKAANVDFGPCAMLSLHTTLAFVKLVNGHASYAFFDENTAGRMITREHLPALGDFCEALHFGAISLIPEPCGSTYEALSSDAKKAHGISPSFAVLDEVAQWRGRELYDSLVTGCGAHAEPLMVVISTMSMDCFSSLPVVPVRMNSSA